jgi:ParB family chromosome partitioning protein
MMTEYAVLIIPIDEIFSDENFNCRGAITPIDVIDLAKSIQTNGLQFPISVQPRVDIKGYVPEEFKYRIVAGHRRYKACKVLQWKTIPAFVRIGLTEIKARILNLSENFDRKDLNILQEAKALEHLYQAGLPRDTVARELNKSSSWVQVRYNLLELPPEIQQEAAAGLLNQYQIKQLYSLDTHEQMYDACKRIKDAKLRGEKIDNVGKKKKQLISVKKVRLRPEMFDMMEILAKSIGYGLHTRVLAWATGEITTGELFQDVKDLDPDFIIPTEF